MNREEDVVYNNNAIEEVDIGTVPRDTTILPSGWVYENKSNEDGTLCAKVSHHCLREQNS